MEKKHRQSYLLRRLRLFWRRNFAFAVALPLLLALAYYALNVEPDKLRIREYTFEHELITPELDGTVIAFAADIHANIRRRPLWKQAIEAINRRSGVSVVLLGGDFINGSGRGVRIEEVVASFPQIKSPGGLYSIPGNHEYRYRHGGFKQIKKAFAERNLILMLDQSSVITLPSGGKFNLVGLDYHGNPHHRENKQRFSKLFRSDMLNIVLCHTPEEFLLLPENAHLTLSGHTHGGQLYLPLLGSVITPGSYGRQYTYGRITRNNQTLLVTSGLGSAYTQARFCMKPEVVFVTLKSLRKK